MARNANGGTTVQNTAVTEAQAALEKAQAAVTEAQETAMADAKARLATANENVNTIVAEIRALGGNVRGRSRRGGRPRGSGGGSGSRASNAESLHVHVARALGAAKGQMSPSEVTAAVIKGGYKSPSDNFPVMVSQTLGKLKATKINGKPVALNPERGVWESGGATVVKAYLAANA